MTRTEFAELQRFMFVRFPEIEVWLSRIEQKVETIDAWFDVLQRTDLHSAKDAVGRIHAKYEPMPSWSLLPATIRDIAARLKEQEWPAKASESLETQRKRVLEKTSYLKPENVRAVWARVLEREATEAAGGK